ncbi:unnamed protein product [Kluyveromyces dobzhanskii CBS 2104]|uniref:WGS project CCBQ000000000 data, contig 00106 n=1 Tax=Kluyveromyces dobzhanskii CBS 2104 TaxID=1427455 RepID=A0A0A8L5I7_9SACH|nr:unnamed protein product [Kluyveromyces dobzhanskii CBS 2104]
MQADGRVPFSNSRMDSGRNMNSALGAGEVPIPFPDELLSEPHGSLNGAGAVPAPHGGPNYPVDISGAVPSPENQAPAVNSSAVSIDGIHHASSNGPSAVQAGQGANYHPSVVQGTSAELGFGNAETLAEDVPKYANSRMANQNFASFPSYMQAHSLMDPSIQEALSPFFQPFGVDASHFPMTNPPIFQSSLATDSWNPRRRRISISNGQIGQLGEDEENVESIYYSQPPPMPPLRASQMPSNRVKVEENIDGPLDLPHDGHDTESNSNNKQQSASMFSSRLNFQQLQDESKVLDSDLDSNQTRTGSGSGNQGHYVGMSKQVSETSSIKSSNSVRSMERQTLPGTAAWKRARLLERNRIAASKCRQRKKIAQEQLQQDASVLKRSNRIMKTKVEYYQKLVSKFKKYMELHMQSCGGNSDGLTMIEEMLKIDHDLHQDEQGNLVRLSKN